MAVQIYTNDAGTGYGESVKFTTTQQKIPMVIANGTGSLANKPVEAVAYEAVCLGAREANSIRWILGAKAMVSSETTRMEIFTRIIFLLRYKSPSGMMNNSPMAYPICEHMAIRLAVNSLMFRSRLIRFSSGWL